MTIVKRTKALILNLNFYFFQKKTLKIATYCSFFSCCPVLDSTYCSGIIFKNSGFKQKLSYVLHSDSKHGSGTPLPNPQSRCMQASLDAILDAISLVTCPYILGLLTSFKCNFVMLIFSAIENFNFTWFLSDYVKNQVLICQVQTISWFTMFFWICHGNKCV